MARSPKPLATVTQLARGRRLQPPRGLAAAVAAEWREIVNSAPADHFVGSDRPLLERYCAAVARCRQAEAELAAHGLVLGSNKSGQPTLSPWVSVLAQAERTIATMATRLRLAPQSRNDPKTVGRAARRHNPSPYDGM